MTPPSTSLQVDYFDGHSARAHRVRMWIENGMLQLAGRDLIRQVPLADVRWPERTRHGMRLAHIQDGGAIQALDSSDWDAWCRGQRLGESLVVVAQQSWRWSMVAAALLVMVTVMGYWWGLPLAARAIAPLIPRSVDQQVGSATMAAMDARWLKPSRLSPAEQARWRQVFVQAAGRHARLSRDKDALPAVPLHWHFRHAGIGPNAFALPDGSIVVTDELIALLRDREDVLLGVIGHEIGHIVLRHGMRTLIQTSLLSAATSAALGDFSSVLAGAPALLGHLAYSRGHEREADDLAVAFMRHNDIRPSSMIVLFDRLASYRASQTQAKAPGSDVPAPPGGDAKRKDKGDGGALAEALGIAFSSHPADDERIAYFRAADLADE